MILKPVICAAFILFSASCFSQKINGQWRGYFNSSGDIVLAGSDNTEYVLELEVNGSEVTGFSYSYFQNRKYYVICSLSGVYYKSTNSMKVTEMARVKGHTPLDWSDCLQTHILTYQKEGDKEELTGRWVTAPGQTGECGMGKTTLTRRTLSKDLSSYNKSRSGTPFSAQKPTARKTPPASKQKKPVTPPLAKTTTPKTQSPLKKAPEAPKPLGPVERKMPDPLVVTPEAKTNKLPIVPFNGTFDKRSSEVVKTITIDHPTFKVDLYDNGDIDGDSISVFYNGKLLLSRKRLTDKPISLTLETEEGKAINELTMYAENLGTIPPNTALMIVTDGDKRYEVRITSDLKKSGTIRFVQKASAP